MRRRAPLAATPAALALAAPAARALTPDESKAAIAALDPSAAKALVERLTSEDLGGRRVGTESCVAGSKEILAAFKAAGVEAEVVTAGGSPHVIAKIAGSDNAAET